MQLEWIGLTPVFADVRPHDHTLDVDSVRRCIGPRTSAIVGVHLWGNPCDVPALSELADEHGLTLLFDASHAFLCERHGRPVGGFGRAEVFSFHATKFVHSVEGGAIVTNCNETADRLRVMRNFGITGLTSVGSTGTNGKLSELSSAVGLASLEDVAHRIVRNRKTQRDYRSGLAYCPGIQLVDSTADRGGNGQYAVCTIDAQRFGMTRDQLLQVLRAEGVLARSYFVPGCHRSFPYIESQVHHRVELPVTQGILDTVMQCPVGSAVTPVVVKTICELLRWTAEHATGIRKRLESVHPVFSHPADPAIVPEARPKAG